MFVATDQLAAGFSGAFRVLLSQRVPQVPGGKIHALDS